MYQAGYEACVSQIVHICIVCSLVSRSHDLVSRVHDLIYCAHQLISRAQQILHCSHQLVSRAQDVISFSSCLLKRLLSNAYIFFAKQIRCEDRIHSGHIATSAVCITLNHPIIIS